jgi:hypothetical protein
MDRFDLDDLDPADPFEVDAGNLPHLFKHMFAADGRLLYIGLEDVRDLYVWEAVLYYPADLSVGDAHWLMVGEIEGIVVTVPLAPPNSGDRKKCRPIGLYQASDAERERYRNDRR